MATPAASGRITRMLLADVSGHGETVSQIAVAVPPVNTTSTVTLWPARGVVAEDISDDILAVKEVLDDFARKLAKLRCFVGPANKEAADVMEINGHRYAWIFRELEKVQS